MSSSARELLTRYRRTRPGAGARAHNWDALVGRLEDQQRRWWWLGVGVFAIAAAAFVGVLALGRGLQAVAERSVGSDAAVDLAVPRPEDGSAVPAVVPAVAVPPRTSVEVGAGDGEELAREPKVPRRPAASPSAGLDRLAQETEQLARLRAAMERDDHLGAAAAIAAHARDFADGAFVEERRAYEVVLACRRSDADAAGRRTAFSRAYPGSPHQRMIHAVCADGGDGSAPPTGK